MFWIIFILALCVPKTKGTNCYRCEESDLSRCDTVVECRNTELCRASIGLDLNGGLHYSLGCASQTNCDSMAFGKRSFTTYSTQCCNTNYCNKNLFPITMPKSTHYPATTTKGLLAPSSTKPPHHTTPSTHRPTTTHAPTTKPAPFSCYHCDYVNHEKECNNMKICKAGEDNCFLARIDGGADNDNLCFYKMGCIGHWDCHTYISKFHNDGFVTMTGTQDKLEYFECCNTGNCNKHTIRNHPQHCTPITESPFGK